MAVYKEFNYNHLYYFYITFKEGGITKAADFLGVAQPSVSTQLQTLEKNLGAKLFNRETRTITPTKFAQEIYSYCEEIFTLTELIEKIAARQNG